MLFKKGYKRKRNPFLFLRQKIQAPQKNVTYNSRGA